MHQIHLKVDPVVDGHQATVHVDGHPFFWLVADTHHEAFLAASNVIAELAQRQQPPAPEPEPPVEPTEPPVTEEPVEEETSPPDPLDG